jgi:hypothetical protein
MNRFRFATSAIALVSACLALPSSAQTSQDLSCRVNGGTTRASYCFAESAAAGYSVANVLNLAPGNYVIEWITPIAGACAPNNTVCVYGVQATNSDQDYVTSAIVTNLDSGTTTELSANFYAQATCSTLVQVCLPTSAGITCSYRPRPVFC